MLLPDLCPEKPLTVLGGPRDSAAALRSRGNQPYTGSHAGFPRFHRHRFSLDCPLRALCGHLKFWQSQASKQGDQHECGRQSPNACVHSTQIRHPGPLHGSKQPVPTPLRFLGQELEEQLEWLHQPQRTCGNLQNWGSRPVGGVSPWTTP